MVCPCYVKRSIVQHICTRGWSSTRSESFGSVPVYAIDVTLNVFIHVLTMLYYSI